MKKLLSRFTMFLLIFSCMFIVVNSNASAKTYKFTGTYSGENLSGENTKIVLKSNKTMKVYINGSLFTTEKMSKLKKNVYYLPGYYIRLKLYGNKIKVYSKDGRDAKIPYGGTFKKKKPAKSYKFSGTYTGYNLYSDSYTKIVLSGKNTMKVYIDGSLFATNKMSKSSTNTYYLPGYYIRLKLYGNKIKVYSSDGRDAKIPYGGIFKK